MRKLLVPGRAKTAYEYAAKQKKHKGSNPTGRPVNKKGRHVPSFFGHSAQWLWRLARKRDYSE
jgi:hypothetical protein